MLKTDDRGVIGLVCGQSSAKVQYATQLGWFGNVTRKDGIHMTSQAIKLVVEGTRPRERPKMRWLGRINADLNGVSAQVVDAQDTVR